MTPEPTPKDYKRYAYPAEGETVSRFGVPGYGDGLVTFDSHEHTEFGRITEERAIRIKMTDKRTGKLAAMQKEALPPVVLGADSAKAMLVCWGSVFEPLREAAELLGLKYLSVVACEQVYPLSDEFIKIMKSPVKKIFVEGNATGQFARVVRSLTGIGSDKKINGYNGFQFSADYLAAKVEEALSELGV